LDPASAALEQLRAANQARTELARDVAKWQVERERLAAIVSATEAERDRLKADAEADEKKAEAARLELATLGAGSDLELVRGILTAGAAVQLDQLRALATQLPPGVVSLPPAGESAVDFDTIIKTVEAAERAAAGVAVEVVTGRLEGKDVAVKLLRVSGAAAWWVSLEGNQAGTSFRRQGVLELTSAARDEDRKAITQAVNISEGRLTPALLVLPWEPFTLGGSR